MCVVYCIYYRLFASNYFCLKATLKSQCTNNCILLLSIQSHVQLNECDVDKSHSTIYETNKNKNKSQNSHSVFNFFWIQLQMNVSCLVKLISLVDWRCSPHTAQFPTNYSINIYSRHCKSQARNVYNIRLEFVNYFIFKRLETADAVIISIINLSSVCFFFQLKMVVNFIVSGYEA